MSALLLPLGLRLWEDQGILIDPKTHGEYHSTVVDMGDEVTAVGWQMTLLTHTPDLEGFTHWEIRAGTEEPWVDLCGTRPLSDLINALGGSVVYTTTNMIYRSARLSVTVTAGEGTLRTVATGKKL